MIKKYVCLFVINIAVIFQAFSQDVPVINTEIIKNLEYSDKDLEEWSSIEKLFIKDESSGYQLTPKERKLYNSYIAKYGEIGEDSFPWILNGIGCSWYCGADYKTKVSSSLKPSGNITYSKDNLGDDDIRKAWVEGVKGYGIGEYIEFIFPYYAPRATSCKIVNGYNKNESTWRNNSRVKTFNIYEDDKLMAIVNLQDTRNLQTFNLPHPFPNRGDNETGALYYDTENGEKMIRPVILKFVITEVYKGDKYDDTAISELIFDGLDVHCLGKGTQITMSDLKKKNIEDIQTGDTVLSYNIKYKSFETKTVKYIHKIEHNNLLRLKFKNSEIITTNDHPFLSNDGWKSFNPTKTKTYNRYKEESLTEYKVGDIILAHSENTQIEKKIESIETLSNVMQTYTIELDGDGAFIANGLIVGQE